MTWHSALITPTPSKAGSTNFQSRAVCLNVTKALTVITLLGYNVIISAEATAYELKLMDLLSAVRGCGQPLDSCPIIRSAR